MKLLSFLSVVTCLVFASNFVSADAKNKQMSFKIDGQTLKSIDGEVRTSSFLNRPLKKGKKGPVATGQRYDEGWSFGGTCYVGAEVGSKLTLINHDWYETVTFSDRSTITEQLIELTVCDVPPTDRRRSYGTWDLKKTIVGGTKRFKGASGSNSASGTYQNIWATQRFVSSSVEGVVNYDLD
ncbi:hypothetical protein N8837_04310 [Pseudomonadales bacterium]|nr:hypothetical protein [Pseudomonadales bacterium]